MKITAEGLKTFLERVVQEITSGDSLEGSIAWSALVGGEYDLACTMRVGNLQGQGGMRMIEGEIEPSVGDGAAVARISRLDAWLESRGLPLTWEGPLDHWRWIHRDQHTGRYTHTSIACEHHMSSRLIKGLRRAGFIIRWDRATTTQRAAALALETR
jgi:hypothetical protein